MNRQVKDLVLQLKAIQIAESQLEKLLSRKLVYEQRISQIEKSIDYDSFAINKLSSNNIFSIYQLLIGKKKDSLELVKRHYLQLSIEYNDLNKSLALIKFEIEVLTRKIANKEDVKGGLKNAFSDLESVIKTAALARFRVILVKSDFKMRLAQEIQEAVSAGEKINARFDEASKCIEDFIAALETRNYSEERISSYKVKNIENYQEIMIKINHDFIMYEVEVNDVYNEILGAKDYKSNILSNFMTEYRLNLAEDLRNVRNLKSSRLFVRRYKEIITGLNEVLKHDLKIIKYDLVLLEKEEKEFLAKVSMDDSSSNKK